MTKYFIYPILIIGIVVMGVQLYRLYNHKNALEASLREINEKIRPLNKENKSLANEIDYFKDSDNLEKELRSRFNYVKPGEKLIIVVPKKQVQ